MSNPWAQSFEELRSPYLQEKKAKKDYDGDGKIESGTDEYMGSKDKAIKKAMAMRGKKKVAEHHTKDKDGNTIPHEDGTPSSVEEMAKKFGPDGDPIKKKGFIDKALDKLKKNTPVRKIDKAHYEPEGEVIDELNKDSQGRMKLTAADVRLNSGAYKKSLKDINNKVYSPVINKAHYEPEGELVKEADKKGKGSGSKDACYHKVKSRYSVWPSAYASGALVKCRKAGAKNWGNSSKKEEFDYYQMPMKSFGDMVGECWKTHKKVGMKMKGGKMVPDCRPKNEERTPALNDPSFSQEYKDNAKKAIEASKKKIKTEAVKNPKLDVKETGVKNKIEINPEIKTEAAKAPVKK